MEKENVPEKSSVVNSDFSWSDDKEDELIDMIQSRPHLYDKKAPGYANRYKKRQAVSEMSKELKVPGSRNK